MPKSIHTQKHIILSDRIYIEQALANHESFKDIAAVLKKDPSITSKEIRKHKMFKEESHYSLKNNCALLTSCNRSRICEGKLCNYLCKRSKTCDCTKYCPDFTPLIFARNSKSLQSSGHRVQEVRVSLNLIGFLPESFIAEMLNYQSKERTA